MLKLRLTRCGTTKRPFYRIVASDSRSKRDGSYIEVLGTYDPKNLQLSQDSSQRQAKGLVQLKTDRVSYWLSVGAQLTPSVKNILRRAKFFEKQAA
jgi:small subunit ribosomal protein S16